MRWVLVAYIIVGLFIDYKLYVKRRKCKTAIQPKTDATIRASVIVGWFPIFLYFIVSTAIQVRKRR